MNNELAHSQYTISIRLSKEIRSLILAFHVLAYSVTKTFRIELQGT